MTSHTTWIGDATAKWNENARTRFSKVFSCASEGSGKRTKKVRYCETATAVIWTSRRPQGASAKKDVEVQRFCQRMEKTGLGGFYYKRVLCEDEMAKHPVWKELELTIGDMLR